MLLGGQGKVADGRGTFGWIGVLVRRWPWAVIGFWVAL
ncbi:MAG: hypothetical protein QOG47_1024, partial [Mycobacterium sp.]|nr:hypothetical protein [Mycobacterium sp.]